jgi:hypothetical protein
MFLLLFMNIKLTPWCKNLKIHHRTHNSPPPVPVLRQSNPIHTPKPISLRSILIPSSHLRLSLPSGLFPSGFPTNNNKLIFVTEPRCVLFKIGTKFVNIIWMNFVLQSVKGIYLIMHHERWVKKHRTSWSSCLQSCFIFGKSWVQIWASRPAILTEIFCGFP